MYKLTDTFVLILLIFAVFNIAYTTLNKLFAVFFHILSKIYTYIIIIPQFTHESKRERIIEISPHLPELS